MKQILSIAACVMIAPQLVTSQTPSGLLNQNQPSSATLQELKKLDSKLDDAYLRGDRKLFERVLADDMISVNAQGDVARKTEILSQISHPAAGLKFSILAEDIQVYLFGDTAIVTSRKTLKEEQSSSSDQYRDTNTYVRKDGRWQLIAGQQARLPPPYSAKEVELDLKIDDALMSGNKRATVVLIEFLDYECPMCRKFAVGTMKQIEKHYIDAGRVGFIVHHNPLEDIHPYAFKAAEAAQCAGAQSKFWDMHRRLFQEPMALTQDDLLAGAQTLKLDMTKFRECLSDEKTAVKLRQEMLQAAGIGVKGTPIFLIGVKKPDDSSVKVLRMIQGAYPYDVFRATLDTMINAQTP